MRFGSEPGGKRQLPLGSPLWYLDYMKASIPGTTKRRGRPRTTGPGTSIHLRVLDPTLEALDTWRAEQDDQPSRPEAIRRLVEKGLGKE